MAVEIHITNEVTGESEIYQHTNHVGRSLRVPTYRLIVTNDAGYRDDYHVTRDTYSGIMRQIPELYSDGDECPPNVPGVPYEGYILTHGEKGFRIGISETRLKERYGGHYVLGVGGYFRRFIQIHIGPAYSEGCFTLSQGIKTRDLFEEKMRLMLARAQDATLYVCVENRHL